MALVLEKQLWELSNDVSGCFVFRFEILLNRCSTTISDGLKLLTVTLVHC